MRTSNSYARAGMLTEVNKAMVALAYACTADAEMQEANVFSSR
jgi:hypothetical protein